MGNCLVTKLNASVDNDALLKLGEIRAKVTGTGEFAIRFSEAVAFDIDGVPQTPSNACMVQVANSEKNIAAYDKYKVTEVYNYNNPRFAEVEFDIDGLKYSPLLSMLSMGEATKVIGDLSALKDKTALTAVNFNAATGVTGDLSDLSLLVNLTVIGLENADGITGDLSSISGLTSVNSFHCGSPKITGALTSLPASVVNITLHSSHITGNLGNLHHLDTATIINLKNCSQVEGNLANWLASIYNDLSRRSGIMNVRVKGTSCTFKGTDKADEEQYVCIFSNNGIRVTWSESASGDLATYDGSDWTFYI